MHASTLASLILLASSVLTTPPQPASSNSTGRLVNSTLPLNVTDTAGGNVPNAPLPTSVSDAVIAQFWIANFLENLEACFFKVGAKNLTEWGTDGYPIGTLEVVRKVAAQEQVHVKTITDILTTYNRPIIQPCQYTFPVTNTSEFLALAQLITTVGIGAVLDMAVTLAEQAPLFLPSLTSLVTVEARHDAFFRSAASNLVPNPAPFDTRISGTWALNLALPFVVLGSCPTPLEFPYFPPLIVGSPASASAGVRRRCGNATADADAAAKTTAMTDKILNAVTTSSSPIPFPTSASIFTFTSTSASASASASAIVSHPPYPPITFTLPPAFLPYLHLAFASSDPLYIAWINQANVPVYTEATVSDGASSDGTSSGTGTPDGTISATIPPGMAGMAFAALTANNQARNVTALAKATLAGPAVVRVS